jgi:hypothetical protein
MSCPEIDKLAQEPDEATRVHLESCAPCRERRAKLARLLDFPAAAEPPPFVLPKLLAQIDVSVARGLAPAREVARPVRVPTTRRLAAAVFAALAVGSTFIIVTSRNEVQAKEQRLENVVSESEWRALGYATEAEFRADGGGK